MNPLPGMVTRCEELSSPKQIRKVLETSERAEQVGLDVHAGGPVWTVLAGVSFCSEPGTAYHTLLGREETDSEGML